MSEFGVGELIYQNEIYDKMNNFSFDFDFYLKWCGRRTAFKAGEHSENNRRSPDSRDPESTHSAHVAGPVARAVPDSGCEAARQKDGAGPTDPGASCLGASNAALGTSDAANGQNPQSSGRGVCVLQTTLGLPSVAANSQFPHPVGQSCLDCSIQAPAAHIPQRAGRVLELCCGTGRLTIPLRQAGIDIMGLDGSESMLEGARRKARQQGCEIEFQKGDMRDFDLGRTFSTIFIPFNSLQNTYSVEDLERIFRCVKNHLEPDGLFIFDIFNPSIHMMVEREKEAKEAFRFTLDDGRRVVVFERCRYDAASQVNRVEWVFRIENEETLQRLDMRCFFPLEMDTILAYNGWVTEVKFGSFDENLFQSASGKQIFICRPASEGQRGLTGG